MRKSLRIPVVGMQHRVAVSTRRMIAARCEEETIECKFEREPDNKHDENAVKVIVTNSPYKGMHIGYVPREVASKLAPLLDSHGVRVLAAVLSEVESEGGTAELETVMKTPKASRKPVVKKKSR